MNGNKFIDVIKYSFQEVLDDFFERFFSSQVFVDTHDLVGFIHINEMRRNRVFSNTTISFRFYKNNLPINSFDDEVDCVNLVIEKYKDFPPTANVIRGFRDLVHDIKWVDELNVFGPVNFTIYELSDFFIHDFLYLLNMRRDYEDYLSFIEKADYLLGEVVF